MTIALAKDVEVFLSEQVRAGACDDASDLVNELLRCVRDQQLSPFKATPELEAWLLEAAEKPTTPLTEADFRGIRERAGVCVRPSVA
jgi:Arc/MetJ-type ribon-helix-helix transcriptional regulator